ncbi:Eco57I restriction-modification methylase domain-containing protein [Halobellus salinisoli]|uniref:Eco57I restriction-modification methylase domain-containing protein n=1 Tax=Halobellus salinisoli TaxID=3108500 RepID=UPI0030091599
MAPTQITRSDILEWNSLEAISQSFVKRGLEIEEDSPQNSISLRFNDETEFLLVSIEKDEGKAEIAEILEESSGKYPNILVANAGYRRFDIFSRSDAAPTYGQLNFDHFGFDMQEVAEEGTGSRTLIERLNRIEGYDGESLNRIYSDLDVVEEFTKEYQSVIEEFTSQISVPGTLDLDSRRHYAQRSLNRVIYLYLLQQMGVLDEKHLEDKHGQISYSGRNVFDEFYSPLFRGELPSDTTPSVEPFLDNFLFEKGPIEEEHPQIRPAASTKKVNELFENVLTFLDEWDWHIAREYNLRRTTWITPRVIGYALERYINKQGSGTYHTPERLAQFVVQESVEKNLLTKFNITINGEYDSIEQVFEEGTTEQIEYLYFDVLSDFHIVDPAVGSGSFVERGLDLLSDIYIECFDILESGDSSRTDELPDYQSNIDRILLAKEVATRRNLHGVDLNPVAKELTQFRLNLSLLSAVTDQEQLQSRSLQLQSELNFWRGNSLIGFVDPGEAVTEDFQTRLTTDHQNYANLRQSLADYREGVSTDSSQITRIESMLSELEGSVDQDFQNQLSEMVSQEFSDEDMQDTFHPFHWYLVFPDIIAGGGFDVVVSNPPWLDLRETISGSSTGTGGTTEIEHQQEYFHKSGSYQLQGNQSKNLSSLFIERAQAIVDDEGVVSMLIPDEIFSGTNHTTLRDYLLRNTKVDYAIGFENHGIFPDLHRQLRFGLLQFQSSEETGVIKTKFRQTTLDILDSPSDSLLEISPETIREYSPNRFSFPAVERENDLQSLRKIVQHRSLSDDLGWDIETFRGLNQAREAEYLFEKEEYGSYPIYGGRNIYQFVHDRTFFDLDGPSYWGVSEDEDKPSAKTRIRERELRELERRFADVIVDSPEVSFGDGTTLDQNEVPMPFDEYRIAYRDVASSHNERTVIASVIPPDVVCLNTLHTIHPYDWRRQEHQIGTTTPDSLFRSTYHPKELFCLLGFLNSIPFDYLIRTKVETHLSDYLIKESQVPRLTNNTPWFDLIWESAAQLNCYGDSFASLRDDLNITPLYDEAERRTTQAIIDASVFRAYGFKDSDIVRSVIDSFQMVRSPRVMDDRYMDEVLDQFEGLGRREL